MGTSKRILLVEDEADLAELVSYNLRRSGFEVDLARDGPAALRHAIDLPPDLVLLDLMIPHISGIQVAKQLRTHPKTANIPIIMLTAKSEESDQIAGLQVGADDYITKPFSMAVLQARVDAILRRAKSPPSEAGEILTLGSVRADLATHEAWSGEDPVKLTLTEFRLLVAMMRGKGKVLSREDLMYTAMGPDVVVTSRTIDVHMAAIRKKLGNAGVMIRTIRGVGYLLDEKAEGAEVEAGEEA